MKNVITFFAYFTLAFMSAFALKADPATNHLAVVIDAPTSSGYSSSLPKQIADALSYNGFAYGDRLTVRSVDGTLTRELRFNYAQGLHPSGIDEILVALINHVTASGARPGAWPIVVEDTSTLLNCQSENTTVLLVSSLLGGLEGTPDTGLSAEIYEKGALAGCSLIVAGAGQGAAPGSLPMIHDAMSQIAEFWESDYALAQ